MDEDKKELENFASGGWLKFKDNIIEGAYVSFRIEDDPFGKKGEKRAVYTLNVDGQEQKLSSKSKRLANKFLEIEPKFGDKLRITRSGKGFDTKYELEILKK